MTNIPFIIIICLILAILFVFIISKKPENFNNHVITIMNDIEGVPTINLIGNVPKKNFIQKILTSSRSKISFNIHKNNDNYSINIPNYNDHNFSGKGLVIAASGNKYRYLTGLYCNLYTIRKFHKSNIPIEIFYVGSSEEFNTNIKNMIINLGNIKIYDLLDKINTNCSESELKGYQTKPLAVLCSSFEEIILMDADGLCLIDPQYLFQSDGYLNNGMLLFKDYVDCMSFISKDFIETIGIGINKYCNYTHGYEIDSSCVVLNKNKCWNALYTICIINVKSDKYHTSKNVLGDKDTWVIGSMFVGFEPFISIPQPSVLTQNDKVIIGHLQSTLFNGHEIFTHYNNQKLFLDKININNFKYVNIKNPKSGQNFYGSLSLPDKVIESFDCAKKAMQIIQDYIPIHLKNKVIETNGIAHGFIP